MTDQEIRIAIAEACGWTQIDVAGDVWGVPPTGVPKYLLVWGYINPKKARLLNYPSDLNAMREARQSLTEEQRKQFAYELLAELGIDLDEPCTPEELFRAIHAVAKPQAVAFLHTVGKWKP